MQDRVNPGKALPAMAKLALKLINGEAMGPARLEGYISRGMRKSFFNEKSGAERAADMLLAINTRAATAFIFFISESFIFKTTDE